jgi:PleD family two-component response regulator
MSGAALTVNASGGVPATATYSGGLALRADGALYAAKHAGRNQFQRAPAAEPEAKG